MLPSIESRNLRRSPWGRSSSMTVSAAARMTVSGVFSSCDALATKSERTASRRRISVTSTRRTTEPPPVPILVRTSSSRPPIPTSRRPCGRTTEASRRSRSTGSRTIDPTGAKAGTSASPRSSRAAGLMSRMRASPVSAISPSATSSRSRASSSRSRETRATCSSSSALTRFADEASRASSVTPDSLIRGPGAWPAAKRVSSRLTSLSDPVTAPAARWVRRSATSPPASTPTPTRRATRAAASRIGSTRSPKRITTDSPSR